MRLSTSQRRTARTLSPRREFGYDVHPVTGELWYGEFTYEWVPGLGELDGFFKKIFKPFRKVIKKAVKIVKKVAPYAAAGAALYFGAPALLTAMKGVSASKVLLPAASQFLTSRGGSGGFPTVGPTSDTVPGTPAWMQALQTVAQYKLAKKQAELKQQQIAAQQAATFAPVYAPGVPGMFPYIGPVGAQYAPPTSYSTPPVSYPAPSLMQGLPPWLLPVALGGGALLLVLTLTMSPRRRR